MAKVCGAESCKNPPEFFCGCRTRTYHCQAHYLLHMKNTGNTHNSGALFASVDLHLKAKLIQEINSKSALKASQN